MWLVKSVLGQRSDHFMKRAFLALIPAGCAACEQRQREEAATHSHQRQDDGKCQSCGAAPGAHATEIGGIEGL
jgi:hypothetical protein